MSDVKLIMCCSSTVLTLFFFFLWETIVLVLLVMFYMTSMAADETVLLFLYTQKRGKAKEENFVQRLRKMQLEERLRNPLAQGLPYSTDEPEVRQRYL
jgi:hypothetical protein